MLKIRVPFFGDVRRYHNLKDEMDAVINQVYSDANFSICNNVKWLEGRLGRYTRMKYVISLDSFVDAIGIALGAVGVTPGDEVITTLNPFSSVAEAICFIDAIPVFVDCEPDTWTMDPALIEEKITPKTKAIVVTHTYGHVADMVAIAQVAKKHNLPIVEDGSQALGAYCGLLRVGELSDVVVASSTYIKNIGISGDCGVMLTNNYDINQFGLVKREKGGLKYSVEARNRLELTVALFHRIHVRHFTEWDDLCIVHANKYSESLADTNIKLPHVHPGYRHIFRLYVIETPERDDLKRFLKERGIITLSGYSRDILVQESLLSDSMKTSLNLPVTRKHAAQCLALPIYPELTSEDIEFVADAIKEWATKHAPVAAKC